MKELLALLKRIVQKQIVLRAVPMEVVSVNKNNATIVAKQEDGPEISDIRLRASIDDNILGVVVFPKVGSSVLIDYIMNDESNPYVSKISEFESAVISIGTAFKCDLQANGDLVLNSGTLKGMVKVKPLTDKLNDIENKVNELKTACSNVIVTLAPSGVFPLASFFTSVTSLVNTQQSQIENTKIKH